MINLFHRCPACGGSLMITDCKCTKCQLEMRGEFLPGQFSTLLEDQLTFIQVFLRVRGNLSEMERVLGISYPTIRNKLDEINGTLDSTAGLTPDSKPSSEPAAISGPEEESRKAILQKVADGQLSAPEALQKLQELRGERP